ncbi:MAG TPA: hypothetical protein PKA77_09035 [Chitinophagaceae bacterium]|jgi:hypothetical protein|nr:hypothetical protein [Chitinophagaceae bacterium]HMU57865.1 hypothetical protein [Chitinophagaceae bacterium]
MKKIRNLLFIAAAITVSLIGCLKEKSITKDSQEKKNSTEAAVTSQNATAKQMSKGNTYHWRKSDAEILAEKNAWLNSMQQKTNLSRGGCGTHLDDGATLIEIYRDCMGDVTKMVYRVWSKDYQVSSNCESTQSATFSNGFQTVNASLVYSNVEILGGCTAWIWDGPCESITTLDYEFNTLDPGPWSPGSILGELKVQFYLGNPNICPLNYLTYQVQGGMSAAQYQNSPARIYVEADYYGGFFFPKTDCDNICPPPNIICPAGGTFTYWLLSNPNLSNQITLQPLNNAFYNFPLGSYGYSCVLWYNIGGTTIYSQPYGGTFTVN